MVHIARERAVLQRHIHMALSGGPGRNEEVLVGHLSRGILKGGMTTQCMRWWRWGEGESV
jgi:hypothetical protein